MAAFQVFMYGRFWVFTEEMRHSRATTTLDIYQQFVPESQQKVVSRLSSLVN